MITVLLVLAILLGLSSAVTCCVLVWELQVSHRELLESMKASHALLEGVQASVAPRTTTVGRAVKPPRPTMTLVLMDANESMVVEEVKTEAASRPRVLVHGGTRYVSSRQEGDRFIYRAES